MLRIFLIIYILFISQQSFAKDVTTITLSNNQNYNEIVFSTKSGITIFVRNNKLWLILSQKNDVNFTDIRETEKEKIINNIRSLNIKSSTPASFVVAEINNIEEIGITASKEDDKWRIKLLKSTEAVRINNDKIDYEISTNIGSNGSLPSVDILGINKKTKTISYIDPDVSDTIVVVPDSQNIGLDSYTFVDFTLLETINGIAIQKLNDNLTVTPHDDKVTISSKTFLNISLDARNSNREIKNFDKIYNNDTAVILNLKEYHVTGDEFSQRLNYLNSLITQSTDSITKSHILANLSMFFFANGWYYEADGVLKLAYLKSDAKIGKFQTIKVLDAAINLMMNDIDTAYSILDSMNFDSIPIQQRSEVHFWYNLCRGIIDYNNGKTDSIFLTKTAKKIINSQQNFLSHYPNFFINELAFKTLNMSISVNNSNDATSLIRFINKRKLSDVQTEKLYYYLGLVAVNTKETDIAKSNFDKCLNKQEDLFLYSHCSFENAKLLFQLKEIDRNKYINTLQAISSVWRGDKFELDVLDTLASLYYKDSDLANGIRTSKIIISNQPQSYSALSAITQSGKSFIEYFKNNKRKSIDNLAFFYEFNDLLPLGSEGDTIVAQVASYMIDLDLLKDAASVMEYQIKNRLIGIDKDFSINTLADIYSVSSRYQDTINLVEQHTNFPFNISNPLIAKRKYIYAKALASEEQYMDVDMILMGDKSHEADEVRANVFFNTAHWYKFNNNSEPYLYAIKNSKEHKFTEKDNLKILKQSISYFNKKQMNLMNNMYLDFKPILNRKEKYFDKFVIYNKIANILNDNSFLTQNNRGNDLRDLINSLVDNK